MLERFTASARQVVLAAKAKAAERGDEYIGPLHLLSALPTGDSVAARVLTELGVDAAAIDRELGPAGSPLPAPGDADAEALQAIGIDLDEIKRKIEENFGEGALQRVPLTPRGPLNWIGRSPLTGDAKQALAESLKEARALRHTYIGTEHLLLGLLRTAERRPRGNLQHAVRDLRLDYPTARRRVLEELGRESA
jgi:ATP-dependent Clp protease ATP-binding subunit ClpA